MIRLTNTILIVLSPLSLLLTWGAVVLNLTSFLITFVNLNEKGFSTRPFNKVILLHFLSWISISIWIHTKANLLYFGIFSLTFTIWISMIYLMYLLSFFSGTISFSLPSYLNKFLTHMALIPTKFKNNIAFLRVLIKSKTLSSYLILQITLEGRKVLILIWALIWVLNGVGYCTNLITTVYAQPIDPLPINNQISYIEDAIDTPTSHGINTLRLRQSCNGCLYTDPVVIETVKVYRPDFDPDKFIACKVDLSIIEHASDDTEEKLLSLKKKCFPLGPEEVWLEGTNKESLGVRVRLCEPYFSTGSADIKVFTSNVWELKLLGRIPVLPEFPELYVEPEKITFWTPFPSSPASSEFDFIEVNFITPDDEATYPMFKTPLNSIVNPLSGGAK